MTSIVFSVFKKPQKTAVVKSPVRKKDSAIKRKKFLGFCEYCKREVKGVDVFYCKYCKKYHCAEHRLPEEHGCPSPKKPTGLTGSVIVHRK
ncbi:MAG: hypothetical protein KJ574_03965 [Nanoarchaeota archaeon]|nr:hypothetical protein [Nanoarchaeota archaeon]